MLCTEERKGHVRLHQLGIVNGYRMSQSNTVTCFVHHHVDQSSVLTVRTIRTIRVEDIRSIDDHIAIETSIAPRAWEKVVSKDSKISVDVPPADAHITTNTCNAS